MEDPQAAARLVRFDKAKVRKHAEVSVPRPVAEPPFPDAQLAYHNNSKVGLNAARRERRGPPGVAARSRVGPHRPPRRQNANNSNILQVILRDHGFHRSDYDSEWNVFWCAGQCDTARFADLKPHQRVNKFPRASALTLKANLWTNFLRMQERFGAEHFGYMPQTCVLPAQIDVLDRWMAAPENAEGVRASATPPAAAGPPPPARRPRPRAVRATTRLPALLPIARCGSSNPPRRTAARASRSTALSRRCRRLSAPSAAWRAGTSTRRTSSAVSSRTSGSGVPRPRGALTPRVRVTRTARAAPPQAVRARDELAPARGLPVRRGLSALRDRAVLDRSDRAPVRETPRHTARRAHSRGSPG